MSRERRPIQTREEFLAVVRCFGEGLGRGAEAPSGDPTTAKNESPPFLPPFLSLGWASALRLNPSPKHLTTAKN